jgi:hypothetical protein
VIVRASLLVVLLGVACASSGAIPEPEGGSVAVPPELALALQQGTQSFYGQLVQRRVNTLETFNDPVLRKFFRSEDLFFDYYAKLAQSLADAHFEKNRPFSVEVQEMIFQSEELARVQVIFRGHDNRPLRPNRVALVRLDHWQYEKDSWAITPGKL